MRRSSAAVVCGLCVFWINVMSGSTYVVAPGGNDNSSGSPSAPWRTLAKANSSLGPGDTLLVRGGTYHERIVPARSGNSGSPIVYRAYPGEQVVVDGPDDTDLNLVTVDVSWVVIQGFTFRNQDYFDLPGNSDYWVALGGSHNVFRYNRLVADGDVFDNIYVRNAASRGIAEVGRYNIIEHCFIRGLSFGIVIAGSSPRYTVVRFDTVHATGQNNIDVGATGDGTTAYHGTLIEYCVLDTSFVEDNIQFEPDYGDPTSTLHNRGTIIRYSTMGNAAENAIDLKGAGHTFIEHNLIYSSSGDDDGALGGHDAGSGGGITANPNTPTRNTIVRNNVIWDHNTGLDMAEGDHYFNNTILNNRRTWQGPNQSGAAHTALRAFNYPNAKRAFLNNIIAGQSNGGIYDWRMDWGDKFHLDNNLYYDAGAPVRFMHRENGSTITTVGLGSWKNELATYNGYKYLQGKDGAAIEANPQFVNAPIYAAGYDPAWNFRPESTSPAIDAGRPVTSASTPGTGSTTLTVDDAYFFSDGFGIIGGDVIRIDGSDTVRILAIDYDRNRITLSEPRTWSAGAGVHVQFTGNAPDIGAYELGMSDPYVPPDDPAPPPGENNPPSPEPLPQAPGAIQLSSPPNGASGVLLQDSLRWVSLSGTDAYQVQVSVLSSFATLAIDGTGIAKTSAPIAVLAGGTTYYWRVRGSNSAGAGPWSEVRSFKTFSVPEPLPQVPGAIVLSSPANGSTGVLLQDSLRWIALSGAETYQVQVSLASSFGSRAIDLTGVTKTSAPIAGLAGGTTYFWRVRGSNSAGAGAWSEVRSFSTAVIPDGSAKEDSLLLLNGDFEGGTQGWTFYTNGTGRFAAGGPAFGGSSAAHITITSEGDNTQLYQEGIALTAQTYYRLTFSAYSTTGHDLSVDLMKHTAPYTNYGLPAKTVSLDAGWRTYSIYLRAANVTGSVADARLRFGFSSFAQKGDEYWIDNVVFQRADTLPLPEAPRFVIPAPGATDQPFEVTLHWTAVDGADRYRVQLATDTLFTHLVCDSLVSDTLITVGPLVSSTCYYRRIRAMNVCGSGTFSSRCYFMTIIAKADPEPHHVMPAYVQLDQNYPNPFNPSTVVRYYLPDRSVVSLKVYNALGAEVATLEDGERAAGEHAISFDAAGLSSGSYFCRLRVNDVIETRKMMLLH